MQRDSSVRTGPVGRVAELPSSYRDEVDASFDDPPPSAVAASVVVVTYHTSPDDLEAALAALDEQTAENMEVIVVDNGNDWPVARLARTFDRVSSFVRLERNRGVTVGRNVGAHVASSELVVFLDDDAVPESDFVAAHRRAHEGRVVGVRGRVLTTKDTFYNRRQSWYDLGGTPVPYHLNTEGNSSYDRETFLSAGGFDGGLAGRAGHEGIDLTYRLVTDGYDRDQFIYHPDPVIYHDIDSQPVSYLKKRATRRYYKRRLARERSGLEAFVDSYETPDGGDSMTDRDRFLAHAFSVASRVGCRFLELQDALGDPTQLETEPIDEVGPR
ncbi:glycosyltransferase family 2 protein [Halosimplex amylolyticum]|uniref:glycosyltransferase family 2 protein n=1 Tax=Halosimplex amylolyticum TaxID=3396616 RepID=UPI003F54E808